MSSFRELLVWKKCFVLTIQLYKLTSRYPSSETYGLVSQMRRAVISILSNISEGHARGTTKEYLQFIVVAHASCAELEAQLLVGQELQFGVKESYKEVFSLLSEVSRMLYSIRMSLKNKS